MFGVKVIFLISAISISCNSAYNIKSKDNKCGIKAHDCHKDLFNKIIEEFAETGVPDAGIPPFDPFAIKNLEVMPLGMIKITIPDGIAKGFKTCRSQKVQTDPEKLMISLELTCKTLSIEGKYIIDMTPTLEAIIGGIKVHGEGHGGVKIEDLKLDLEMPFEIKQLEDSELHLVIVPDKLTYTIESIGNLAIHGDNMYVGSQDISTVAVNIFNENWKFFAKSFGNTVLDSPMGVAFEQVNKFFTTIPLKDLISGDLSPYV